MKKLFSFFLAMLLCFCLIACDNNDKDNAAVEGGSSSDNALSGETAWLPSVITYVGSDGTRFDMQTIEMEGTVARIRFYYQYNGNTFLSSGYDVDLAKTNPLELTLVRSPAKDGSSNNGLRRFTVSEDGTTIVKESAYKISEGINNTTTYTITYDAQNRIEQVFITDKYEDNPEDTEERFYLYGETGYTISYTDMDWSQTDDDGTKVLRHYTYEIPYEGDKITITETYRKQDGSVHYPDDFHTGSDQKVEKLVYEANRQGFCTANTLYLKNGQTETNQDFFGNLRFSAEFNDKGMPTKYVTTSMDGTNPHTSTFTYDANGNLTNYHEESSHDNFSYELQWKEYPAELSQIFAAAFNFSNFAIREVIEDNCPEILLGPQELIYQKDAICN